MRQLTYVPWPAKLSVSWRNSSPLKRPKPCDRQATVANGKQGPPRAVTRVALSAPETAHPPGQAGRQHMAPEIAIGRRAAIGVPYGGRLPRHPPRGDVDWVSARRATPGHRFDD